MAAPRNGTASAVITWTAAPDGGSPITGYEVQVGTGAVQKVGTALTYTANNLAVGVDTTIRVRAVNKNGNGPWTAVKAHPEIVRTAFYQCQSNQVADIYMLNKDNDCSNAQANRWNPGVEVFRRPATEQPGTVQ